MKMGLYLLQKYIVLMERNRAKMNGPTSYIKLTWFLCIFTWTFSQLWFDSEKSDALQLQ